MAEIKDLNEALRMLNKIEDARDVARAAYEVKDEKLRAAKEQVEQYMLQEMKSQGFDSYAVPGQGTANIRTKRRFGASDWGLVWAWIVENKCPEMLQKRLLDSAVQTYLDDKGELPPGVSTEAKLVIAVTKR